VAEDKYKGCHNIVTAVSMVRKEILGKVERKILEAYLKGERLKGYNTLLWRIRTIGLKAIIEGCERDLALLRNLAKSQSERDRSSA
jgi:hypothetical protein